jgi:thymidylate synthase
MNRLDEQYQRLLQDIIEFGVEKKDRTGTGTKSLFGYTIRHNMRNGFPLLTTKKMAWKQIVTELIWFLRGDTNIKYLVDNDCHIWDGDAYKNYAAKTSMDADGQFTKEEFINKIKTDDKFAKKWGDLGRIYGAQWRSWDTSIPVDQVVEVSDDGEFELEYNSIDQIQNLINELKTNPDSRRLMVSAWNVGELDQMVLPPCHFGFQVYTRELTFAERLNLLGNIKAEDINKDWFEKNNTPKRAISLMWNQRSVDTFLGLPFNIASYGLLLEIIAKEVNMVPDELIGNLGDTHLYLNHIEQAKQQMDREPFESPKLKINTEFWQTESGECGIGPLKTNLMGFEIDDFTLENYQSHPTIKAPLSN